MRGEGIFLECEPITCQVAHLFTDDTEHGHKADVDQAKVRRSCHLKHHNRKCQPACFRWKRSFPTAVEQQKRWRALTQNSLRAPRSEFNVVWRLGRNFNEHPFLPEIQEFWAKLSPFCVISAKFAEQIRPVSTLAHILVWY